MKVFILQKIGVYDYEQFSSVELVTNDCKKAKMKYEELKKNEIKRFKNIYGDTREWIVDENNDNTMIDIYLEGYSMDDSVKIEIVGTELN